MHADVTYRDWANEQTAEPQVAGYWSAYADFSLIDARKLHTMFEGQKHTPRAEHLHRNSGHLVGCRAAAAAAGGDEGRGEPTLLAPSALP